MPYCSGVCLRYKHKRSHGEKWYIPGVKRCNFCKIFMKTEVKNCPCCKTTMRTQGRGTDVKQGRDLPRVADD